MLKSTAPQKLAFFFKCKLCSQEFPGFYILRQNENNHQHGFPFKTANVDPDDITNEVNDANLKEELHSRQHFLVDSKLEKTRHKVFSYAVETVNERIVKEKLDLFFNNLKCAAKVNLALGILLKNIEDGVFRYINAHENNTLLDRWKLVCNQGQLCEAKRYSEQN